MDIDDALIAALESPLGVELVVSDMEVFKRRFYARRKALAETEPGFATISLRPHPQEPEEKAWLVRQDVAAPN